MSFEYFVHLIVKWLFIFVCVFVCSYFFRNKKKRVKEKIYTKETSEEEESIVYILTDDEISKKQPIINTEKEFARSEYELRLWNLTDDARFFDQPEAIAELMLHYDQFEYQKVSWALVNKMFLLLPNVSKENAFSSARFLGRLIGYNVAAYYNPRKLCRFTSSYYVERKSGMIVSSVFSYKEEKAVLALQKKVLPICMEDSSKTEYRLGLLEGTAILLHGEAPSLLYTETDYDVNKNVLIGLMMRKKFNITGSCLRNTQE